MLSQSLTTTLPALIAHLQRVPAEVPEALEPVQAEADKITLRHAREIAPYRSGALHDSLHVVGPSRAATGLQSTIEPEPEIFYSIYLVKKGGRLDWVSRTIDERPDIAQRAAQQGAAAIAKLIEDA